MLGKENRQTSFFDTDFVCAHLIDKKSFYAKMHKFADKIITDDEFADILLDLPPLILPLVKLESME